MLLFIMKNKASILCNFKFICVFGGLIYGIVDFKLVDLYKAYFVKSSFIEENYVDPKETKLIFPEKREMLFIFTLNLWKTLICLKI